MRLALFTPFFGLFLGLIIAAHASPAFDSANGLLDQHHFREAETALRDIVKAEPTNAAAYHALARVINARLPIEEPAKDEAEARTKDAAQCITRAMELAPNNPDYIRDYGMSLITGITSIKKGRKYLEDAVALNPKDVDGHDFLCKMYSLPWVVGGDKDKAASHRQAFESLDPSRFALEEVNRLIWEEKNFPAAFSVCESLLQKNPDSTLGHFLYGYVAAESKTNMERGMASLKKAIILPTVTMTGNSAYNDLFITIPSSSWEQIGKIERELGHLEAARAAFTTAVELDPANHWAAKSLAKLKSRANPPTP